MPRLGSTFAGIALCGLLTCGCLNIKAPEKVVIGGDSSEPVDSSSTPRISTVEEGRTELDKAYRALRRLEERNADLASDVDEMKRERDQAKRERDKYKEELEDLRDD